MGARQAVAVTLLSLLVACGAEPRGAGPRAETADRPVPDVGGRRAEVDALPGALPAGARIVARPAPAEAAHRKDPTRAIVGPVWDLIVDGPAGSQPAYPLPVRLPYDPRAVREGEVVSAARWAGDRWESLPDTEDDPLLGVVSASADHFSVFAPTAGPPVRELGRWYGDSKRVEHFGGLDVLLWGQTPWTRTETFRWQVREEYHERLRWRRLVFESAAWELRETKFQWIGGRRGGPLATAPWPGQEALQLGQTYSEVDLNAPLTADERRRLEAARSKVTELEGRARDLIRRYNEAPHDSPERGRIALEFQQVVQPQLRKAQFEADEIEFTARPRWVVGEVSHRRDAETGEMTVAIGAQLADLEPRRYVRTWLGYPSLAYDGRIPDAPQAEMRSERVFDLGSPTLEGPHGAVLRSEERAPGIVTTHEYGGLAPETAREPRLTVRGHVFHRLHQPREALRPRASPGPRTGNFVGAGGSSWSDLAPRLFAVPRVRIDLFRKAAGQADFPLVPMSTGRTADDGSFAVVASVERDDVLRIRATYDLADAELEETCTIDVPMVVLAEDGILADTRNVQAEWISARRCEVSYRHKGGRVTHDLGDDARPCVLRRDDAGRLSLEFNGMNALFLGSFCYRARHVNQIRNPYEVTVDARVAEIRAGMPEAFAEEVNARLAADVDSDGNTVVGFQGWEVCFAASTLMLLDALWLAALAPDGPEQNEQIQQLGQGIYDHVAGEVRAGRRTWDFPFPAADEFPSAAVRDAVRAEQAAAGAGRTPRATRQRWAAALGPHRYWPYAPADAQDDNKNWLLSRGGYRPWQWTDNTAGYVDGRFGASRVAHLEYSATVNADVFEPATHPELLERLGGGAVAMTSVRHRAAGSTPTRAVEGGHVMLVLGVVLSTNGHVVRVLVNDPYGDLSQHPEVDGYYGASGVYDRADPARDFDPEGHKGAYAPYGNWPHPTPTLGGKADGKWVVFYWRPDMASRDDIRERLLKPR